MAPSAQNREKLNWFLLESVLIVLSILLAFWIDAWRDDLQAEERLAVAMSDLVPAFSANIETLSETITEVTANKDFIQQFVALSPEEFAASTPTDVDEMLASLWRKNPLDNGDAYITGIRSSGRLDSLADTKLQTNLKKWQGLQGEFGEMDALRTNVSNDASSALAEHEEYAVALSQDPSERLILSGAILRRMRQDSALVSLAARKAFAIRIHLSYTDKVQKPSREILTRIEVLQD